MVDSDSIQSCNAENVSLVALCNDANYVRMRQVIRVQDQHMGRDRGSGVQWAYGNAVTSMHLATRTDTL